MPKKERSVADLQPERVLDLKPGEYSDGHPLDEVQYLECKIILKPDRFDSVKSFQEYGKLAAHAAEQLDIGFITKGVDPKPELREVVFFDTSDFRLYNNAFILRRRVSYVDGFPAGEPEIVFKFRHHDMQTAAELDVRPSIAGDYRIKFKAEGLPLKDRLGGYRLLFSHNVEFGLSAAPEHYRDSTGTVMHAFPCLASCVKSKTQKVELVNRTVVEEVLQELGVLDFGKGITAKTNVALWRERGMHTPLVGEFSFQAKFKRRDELHEKAMERCKQFFILLQQTGADWVSLGTTKTGVVYRLKGNPPQAHE